MYCFEEIEDEDILYGGFSFIVSEGVSIDEILKLLTEKQKKKLINRINLSIKIQKLGKNNENL